MVQIEQLEQEVAELQQSLADKREQESAMIQVWIWFVLSHVCFQKTIHVCSYYETCSYL